MLLKNKVAVIDGSSGAVGSPIAGAFAREGARVFLTGRNRSKVYTVVKGIMDAKAHGISWEQFHEMTASKNHWRRLLTLAEMSTAAVFMPSDRTAAMTGPVVNLSMGMLDG